MPPRTPYYVGAIAGAAALVAIVGYASCGSRGGAPERSAEDVGRDADDGTSNAINARGSAADGPAGSSRSATGDTGSASGERRSDTPATNAPGSPGSPGSAAIDGGSPSGSTKATSTVASSTNSNLRPGLNPGESFAGFQYQYPSGGRGPCGCKASDVCVRSSTGVGAVVDLCLPRPSDCDPLGCGCFSPSPCGSKRQTCSDRDAKTGILNCSSRRGVP